MICIIKHGNPPPEVTCSRCGCVFTFDDEDVSKHYGLRAVQCPDCGRVLSGITVQDLIKTHQSSLLESHSG